MKYAFMTFSCPELGLDDVLSLARRYGYDGVEPRISADQRHGIEFDTPAAQRKMICEKVIESGIALCCIATSCSYADPATAPASVEDTRRAIDLAGDIGASRIRVFGGNLPDGMSREEATERLVKSMNAVADHAQARGVTVCMETHDGWCLPDHLAEVMRRVNHPAIAVNWDIMHPVRSAGATMDAAFETLKPWIRHVHFHDGRTTDDGLQLTPIGEGSIDHRRALELLHTLPFDGYLSGEWINWEPYDAHLPRELAAMKRLEAEIAGAR